MHHSILLPPPSPTWQTLFPPFPSFSYFAHSFCSEHLVYSSTGRAILASSAMSNEICLIVQLLSKSKFVLPMPSLWFFQWLWNDRGWDGWMASLTQWTMSLSKLWQMIKDREAWRAAVHGVTKSRTQPSDRTTWNVKVVSVRDFADGAVVKTLSSNAGSAGSIPSREAGNPTWLVAQKPKHRTETVL